MGLQWGVRGKVYALCECAQVDRPQRSDEVVLLVGGWLAGGKSIVVAIAVDSLVIRRWASGCELTRQHAVTAAVGVSLVSYNFARDK